MLPDRHARSPSTSCRGDHGSKTDDRSAGHDAESPALARPTPESPSACRCSRLQAIPARRSAMGSLPPSISQCCDDCRQRRLIDRPRDPHPSSGRKLDLDCPASGRPGGRSHCRFRLRGHYRRYEAHLLFGSVLLLDPKQPPPLQQQRSRNAVSPRCRRNLAWRLQTLQHDLELLILGPASPPTRLHHFKPPDLSTVRMTVHKDSSQHRASSDKAVSAGGILTGGPANVTIAQARAAILRNVAATTVFESNAPQASNDAVPASIGTLDWRRHLLLCNPP